MCALGCVKRLIEDGAWVQRYNEKSDIYSYGVVLWEIFTGQVPWVDMSAMQVRSLSPASLHIAKQLMLHVICNAGCSFT